MCLMQTVMHRTMALSVDDDGADDVVAVDGVRVVVLDDPWLD